MSEILKMLQLAQHHGVAKMQVGSGRVHAELHAQRLARGARLLQLGAQIGLADNFRRALLRYVSCSSTGAKVGMGKDIIRNEAAKAESGRLECQGIPANRMNIHIRKATPADVPRCGK